MAPLAVLLLGSPLATHGQSPAASNLDPAIALLTDARLRFRQVHDYECTLLAHERVRGELLPENIMLLRVRQQPFSVSLRFQAPAAKKGQEVCYVAGRNQGLMRVHPTGLRGIIGFVSIDPRDPRALQESRHPVTEAGLGTLLESTARYWEGERRLNQTTVRIADSRLDGRPCTWIETVHPVRNTEAFYAYRCVLCLDRDTGLPVHSEAYDWPHPGGAAEGDLLESYTYLNIRCNIGLSDRDFDR